MRHILAVSLLAALPALADDAVLTGERGYYARLQDAPCTDQAILEPVRDTYKSRFRTAIVGTPQATIPECWYADGDEVLLAFQDGSHIVLPVAGFKRTKGV